jgi:hypothetical protein
VFCGNNENTKFTLKTLKKPRPRSSFIFDFDEITVNTLDAFILAEINLKKFKLGKCLFYRQ